MHVRTSLPLDPMTLAVDRALRFLSARQSSNGEFRCYASTDPTLRSSLEVDPCVFATALVCDSLSPLRASRRAATMRARGLSFLLSEQDPSGLWRYAKEKSMLPFDVDDSAVCARVLGRSLPPAQHEQIIGALLANRTREGLFKTWMWPAGAPNDVDHVVNANVLWYLGERPETQPVIAFLNEIVAAERERDHAWYYVGEIALYHAIARAYRAGTRSLAPARERIARRLTSRQSESGSFGTALATALGVLTLLHLEVDDGRAARSLVGHLLAQQGEEGGFSRAAYFMGPFAPAPRSVWFGSEELTTALALEALVRYRIATSAA